jgi:hypothetical protein
MQLHHLIPAERLNKSYFRRWFYWRGVSRAIMYAQSGVDMEHPADSDLDFRQVAHIAGVPRYLFRTAVSTARDLVVKTITHRPADETFERELWLWMFAGIVRQRWRDRHVGPGTAIRTTTSDASSVAPGI